MLRKLFNFIIIILVIAGSALLFGYWWIGQPLRFNELPEPLIIERGTSARGVANKIHASGLIKLHPTLIYFLLRASGQGGDLKAGYYEFQDGVTPQDVLDRLIKGEQTLMATTIVEGWTFRQVRQMLVKQPVSQETAKLTDAQIMQALGRDGIHPEGRFFPDTYHFVRGSSDLDLLRQALTSMDKHLDTAWQLRDMKTPLKNADEALILASIVEKETSLASDRAQIAGVFINRLRIGMLLQTDPSVIYGLGDSFDGRLRRRHLQEDTPWNTYKRAGLPITPIAMPGKAALLAAVQPQTTSALYFVSRGDGSSQFSNTLQEHNRAVDIYIRGRK